MKSAYELAMERMAAESDEPIRTYTDEEKAALKEIDVTYEAKIAEKEVFLGKQINESRIAGDAEAVAQLEQQLKNEKIRLEEERESKKDKIRNH